MTSSLIWAGALLAISAMITCAALRGWRGWLELRRFELATQRNGEAPDPTPGVRIEMADLKERLRRLEAIAQGVDL
jgi:hypothetical protein